MWLFWQAKTERFYPMRRFYKFMSLVVSTVAILGFVIAMAVTISIISSLNRARWFPLILLFIFVPHDSIEIRCSAFLKKLHEDEIAVMQSWRYDSLCHNLNDIWFFVYYGLTCGLSTCFVCMDIDIHVWIFFGNEHWLGPFVLCCF